MIEWHILSPPSSLCIPHIPLFLCTPRNPSPLHPSSTLTLLKRTPAMQSHFFFLTDTDAATFLLLATPLTGTFFPFSDTNAKDIFFFLSPLLVPHFCTSFKHLLHCTTTLGTISAHATNFSMRVVVSHTPSSSQGIAVCPCHWMSLWISLIAPPIHGLLNQ